MVLNGSLLTGGVNLLLQLLVTRLELVELNVHFVKLVLLKFDLVRITFYHYLLDLVLLYTLGDSVFFAGCKRRQLFEAVGSCLHVEAFERDTELFTDTWIIDLEYTTRFFVDKLFLGLFYLAIEDQKAPKKNGFINIFAPDWQQ